MDRRQATHERRTAEGEVPTNNVSEEELLKLIQDAAPEMKPVLMVLFQIHRNLTRNTDATLQMAGRFDAYEKSFVSHTLAYEEHVKQDKALFDRGYGAWRVIALTVAVVIVLGGYILTTHVGEFNRAVSDLRQLQLQVHELSGETKRNSQLIDRMVAPVVQGK